MTTFFSDYLEWAAATNLKDESKKVEALKKIIKPEIQHCFLDETH